MATSHPDPQPQVPPTTSYFPTFGQRSPQKRLPRPPPRQRPEAREETFWEPEEFTVMWREEKDMGEGREGWEEVEEERDRSWEVEEKEGKGEWWREEPSMLRSGRALLKPDTVCTFGSLNTEVVVTISPIHRDTITQFHHFTTVFHKGDLQ